MELKLINVSKQYPSAEGKFIRSLESVNLDINYGNYISFVGPSGSGKSTLLNIMTGNLRPSAGDVFWGKNALSKITDSDLTSLRRQKFGIVFQDSRFFSELTIEDNIKLPLIINSINIHQKKSYFSALSDQLKIVKLLKRYPYELSGGEKKKAAIARALINNPEILIADEPTANLDEESAREVFAIFSNLNKMGLSIVIATHDARFGAYCQESYTMSNGKIEKFSSRCTDQPQ